MLSTFDVVSFGRQHPQIQMEYPVNQEKRRIKEGPEYIS